MATSARTFLAFYPLSIELKGGQLCRYHGTEKYLLFNVSWFSQYLVLQCSTTDIKSDSYVVINSIPGGTGIVLYVLCFCAGGCLRSGHEYKKRVGVEQHGIYWL